MHFYAKRLKCAQTWITHFFPANYTMPAFTPQPQNIITLWLVLIYRPTEGRRLSLPGWLHHYWWLVTIEWSLMLFLLMLYWWLVDGRDV